VGADVRWLRIRRPGAAVAARRGLRGWLHASVAATLAATAGIAVVPAVVTTPAAAAAPVCRDVAASENDALTTAAACHRPVVVGASQSEYVQVLALPDGRLRFESAVVPQRTRRSDGSWAPVDLTLRRDADGLLRPVASPADVSFSPGGDGPLASLKRGGKSLQLSWPGRLPAPAVSGDSATYANVLPDVDLVVRATHTGFTHVLVLKSRTAAANAAVRRLSLKVSGDAHLDRQADGSLRAIAGTALLAQTEPAVMWDSSRSAPSAGRDLKAAESTASVAGDGARTAAVATEVAANGDLVLVPDVKLLDRPDVTFPVFVDPAWSVAKSKWAYATSNGCTNTDYSVARVGLSPEGPCPGVRFRSFFEFPTTSGTVSLKGKHIESAYVQMKLYHSWSCTSTWTHMYLTPAINATMKASWSSMSLSKWLSSAEGHANKGTGCSDSPQPDMYMNFDGSTVTGQVQTAASNSWSTITVGFCACNANGDYETSQDRWKKFYPANAKLVVDYDSIPGKPTGLQVAGVACPASGVLTIGTLTPTFSAVYPDADSGQTLTGTYEWVEVPSGGIGTVTDTYPTRLTPPSKPPATANGRATTSAVTVVKGKTYAYRVTAVDPAPYSQWSGWSIWCQFTVDTTVPPLPTISAGTVMGPGKPITFTFSTTTTDVVKFRYGWVNPPTTEISASGTTTKTATVTLTLPKYGQNFFWVRAIDGTGNLGNIGSKEIIVGRPSPAVARWGLETYPGQTQAQALADQQLAGGELLSSAQSRILDTSAFVANTTVTDMSPDTTLGQGGSTDSLRLAPQATGSSEDTFAAVGGDTGGLRLGLQPGRSYRAAGWIYVPAATGLNPTSSRGLRIVAFYKTDNYYETASAKASIMDGWQYLSVDFTVPGNASEAFIRLYNGFRDGEPDKVVYWDNLSVAEKVDSPLTTASNVQWQSDVRIVGGQTAGLNGSSSYLSTAGSVLDVNKSFSVAAWVRLGAPGDALPTSNKAAVVQDGDRVDSFVLGYRADLQKWEFWIHGQDVDNTGSIAIAVGSTPVMGRWTHLAGMYDAASRTAYLYVDGQLAGSASASTPPQWSTSRRVVIGRELWNGSAIGFWPGQIADVQLFDRTLVDNDFLGQLASAADGGLNEPGILAPIEVGRWDFEVARPCYIQDLANTCDAADGTPFGRWLALSRGAEIDEGYHNNGLSLDGYYFPDENSQPWEQTHEYGRSAKKNGTLTDEDGNQYTNWQDSPVLRTDQSFTVSAWVKLDRTDVYQTVLGQDAPVNSGFYLYYGTDTNGDVWKLKMQKDAATADGGTGGTIIQTAALDAGQTWRHLVGVLDAGRRQMRLYVDGDLKATGTLNAAWQPWQAGGPLTVGRTWGNFNTLFGSVDDIRVYQGAMTDTQVDALFNALVVKEQQP
jgi:Concanavalin A-like lectin/glucanases superfamily